MMQYQVEHCIQMLMKLSICKGLWYTRHAFLLKLYLFYFLVCCYLFFRCTAIYLFIAYCVKMYCFQDSAIIVLNKPPKLPVKVWMPILSHLHKFTLSLSLFWDLISCLLSCRVIFQFIIAWMHWLLQHCPMIMMRVLNW